MVSSMSKRRRTTKKQRMERREMAFQILGVIFSASAILGLGFGTFGLWIKKQAMLILGEWWLLLLVLLLVVGIIFVWGKGSKKLNIPTRQLVAICILLIILLVFSHLYYIDNYQSNYILDATKVNYNSRISTLNENGGLFASGQKSIKIGGGMVGAAFASIFANLFGKVGTIVVMVVLTIISLVLMFEIDLGSYLETFFDWVKEKKEERLLRQEEEIEEETEAEEIEEDSVEVKTNKKGLFTRLYEKIDSLFEDEEEEEEEDNISLPEIANEVVTEEVVETTPVIDTAGYVVPSLDILDKAETNNENPKDKKEREEKAKKLVDVLADFQINGATVVDTHAGPAVTQFELDVPSGTKVSKILNINKEIALKLAAKDVRIEAPIPGKSTVGIEIPNGNISAVKIRGVLQAIKESKDNNKGIQVALGKDLMGRARYCDITKMPHLLIAGSTGSGKSVCTNSMIISILMRYKPDEVKLVLIDPKQVELSNYNGVPHLLLPVVTDPKKASATLQRIVAEMDDRYRKFAETGVKKIDDYNDKVKRGKIDDTKMPYIVVIIDEMADLMVAARKEVEESIMRITQLARAAGIHLITATQRPSVDVITGVIKANIPSRIAFAVASQVDSKTILDGAGAEKLLGKGDMLYLPMGQNKADRIQGCFVTDDEIEKVIKEVTSQQKANYDDKFNLETVNTDGASNGIGSGPGGTDDDPLYNEIYEFAVEQGKISASLIQRRFRLGYNRAARIIDTMEERGVIGPQNGSKPREVLVGNENTEE